MEGAILEQLVKISEEIGGLRSDLKNETKRTPMVLISGRILSGMVGVKILTSLTWIQE